jgi:hypothetical protein
MAGPMPGGAPPGGAGGGGIGGSAGFKRGGVAKKFAKGGVVKGGADAKPRFGRDTGKGSKSE